MRRIALIAILILSWSDLFSMTRIFMLSRVSTFSGKKIMLGDVARIEGEDSAAIGSICVPDTVLSDNYIDRNEMKSILESKYSGAYYLGGSGVRLVSGDNEENKKKAPSLPVRRGEMIKIIVKKRNVNLEIYGTVERDSSVGDMVFVKLPNGKRISGLIVDQRKVLVEL